MNFVEFENLEKNFEMSKDIIRLYPIQCSAFKSDYLNALNYLPDNKIYSIELISKYLINIKEGRVDTSIASALLRLLNRSSEKFSRATGENKSRYLTSLSFEELILSLRIVGFEEWTLGGGSIE